jgi:heme exporter protein D
MELAHLEKHAMPIPLQHALVMQSLLVLLVHQLLMHHALLKDAATKKVRLLPIREHAQPSLKLTIANAHS